MTTTVVKKKETNTALDTIRPDNSWGSEGIDASDVVLPRLLLMQGLSELVQEGKTKSGDIIRSTTGEVLGGAQKGVEIIPISSFKTWKLLEIVGKKYEYRGIEPLTAENTNAPLEFLRDGKTWRRDRVLNFYVLLPGDIAKEAAAMKKIQTTGEFPDPRDALFPCVLSFARTSYGAGKDLASHFIRAASFNMPPACSRFSLSSKVEKNDLGTFSILEVNNLGMTSAEDLAVCKKWYEIIFNTKGVKVDDPESKKETPPKGASARGASTDIPPIDLDNDIF